MDENNSEKDWRPPRVAPRAVQRARARRGNQHVKIDDEFRESSLGEIYEDNQKLDEGHITKMEGDNSGPLPLAHLFTLGEQQPRGNESNTTEVKPGSPFQRTSDEDILGPCVIRFDLETHIPPVEYG
jgi:DNA ligase 4